jgi:hypothetical protein
MRMRLVLAVLVDAGPECGMIDVTAWMLPSIANANEATNPPS